MISLKNPSQIAKMRDAGKILREVEDEVRLAIRPGVSTAELDELAERLIRRNHAIPSSLHYEGYPCSICASLNDEVVHGIPSKTRILQEGDILSVDCTLLLDGWQADSAFTAGVGTISAEAEKLIRVTEECFWQAMQECVTGKRLGDIGHAVQQHAEANGCTPIREFTGHGIGREMHEDPSVLNYGEPGRGLRLRGGMTLAIEPMISAGDWHLSVDEDGWCARTLDHSLTAHYEHTIAVAEEGLPEILTLPGFSWEA
jgi:methionyl aminopeptidase